MTTTELRIYLAAAALGFTPDDFDKWLAAAVHRLKDDIRAESADLIRSFR